jgi:acetyl esterase/lipase
VDPQIAELLPLLEADTAGRLAALERDVNEVRRQREELAKATQGQGPAVALQEDRTIPGPAGDIPVRVFVPQGEVAGAYLHIHGGGWVLGSERYQDPVLRTIASAAGVAVVSVGYRLAPEHPYPAGLEDCLAASRWLERHAGELGLEDPSRLAIGGESAGANLAAATLLRRRDEMDAPYRAAALTYGVFSAVYDLPSMKRLWDRNLVLSGPIMEYFSRSYAEGRDLRAPYISPLYADLKGMPPAIFSVGTLDHLYSDTLLMVEAWRRAGNEAELHEYRDAPHGFNLFPQLDIARSSNERIVAFLRRHIGR